MGNPMNDAINFDVGLEEIVRRCLWLGNHICSDIASTMRPHLISSITRDSVHEAVDGKLFFEAVAYSSSLVVERLRDEIEENHGWTDGSYNLHMDYALQLGWALGVLTGAENFKKNFFTELLYAYYTPEDVAAYELYWEIPEDCEFDEALYSKARWYVFRVRDVVKVVDKTKMADRAEEMYGNVGLAYYNDAFFMKESEEIIAEVDALGSLKHGYDYLEGGEQEVQEGTCALNDTGEPIPPRDHHYIFAHNLLPSLFFKNPLAFIEKSCEGGTDYAAQMWQRCGETFVNDRSERLSHEGVSIRAIEDFPVIGCIYVLPKATNAAEAIMICALGAIKKTFFGRRKVRSPRYFTLEMGINAEGKPRTVLCEWQDDGNSRQHLNYGDGPAAIPEEFLRACISK